MQTITWHDNQALKQKKLLQLEKKLHHYVGKAIADFNLISRNDNILVCVSGGKDSLSMLKILQKCRVKARGKFNLHAFTLDQMQPGWDDSGLRAWYDEQKIDYTIISRDTYSVVKEKIPEDKTYCGLCSRLRRGNIYRFAKENGFNKIALGHHRDDAVHSLLMAIFYNGEIRSMPPKLRSDDGENIVIRPLIYCQEADIAEYSQLLKMPIIPCNLCGSQTHIARVKIKQMLQQLSAENAKIPSNILHALQTVRPSHLLDKSLWDFNAFEPKG